MNEKVSIIIPCYNTSKTLVKCLKSVLNQTYRCIEVIIVNDGSTDDTEAKILSMQKLFDKAGMGFIYVKQENKGLGGAIRTGLSKVNGEYLCWIDSDDYLLPESLEKRLNCFKENPEVAVVSSDAFIIDSKTREPIGTVASNKHMENPWQFENHLLGKAIFCAGCHMVKMCAFDSVVPNRDIYPARRGQNWQMLLPLYYSYPQFFLNEPLYAYVVYQNSMSKGDDSKEKLYTRYGEHRIIVEETLNRIAMPEPERKKYKHLYSRKYYREMFYESLAFHDYLTTSKYLIYMIVSGEWNKNDFANIGRFAKRKINKLRR